MHDPMNNAMYEANLHEPLAMKADLIEDVLVKSTVAYCVSRIVEIEKHAEEEKHFSSKPAWPRELEADRLKSAYHFAEVALGLPMSKVRSGIEEAMLARLKKQDEDDLRKQVRQRIEKAQRKG